MARTFEELEALYATYADVPRPYDRHLQRCVKALDRYPFLFRVRKTSRWATWCAWSGLVMFLLGLTAFLGVRYAGAGLVAGALIGLLGAWRIAVYRSVFLDEMRRLATGGVLVLATVVIANRLLFERQRIPLPALVAFSLDPRHHVAATYLDSLAETLGTLHSDPDAKPPAHLRDVAAFVRNDYSVGGCRVPRPPAQDDLTFLSDVILDPERLPAGRLSEHRYVLAIVDPEPGAARILRVLHIA